MIDHTPWIDRSHPGRPTVPLELCPAEREEAEALLRAGTTEQRVARRAQALLMLADGVAAMDVARLVGVNERTMRRWVERFKCDKPSEKLADAPRSGRPRALSRTKTAQ